MTAVAERTELAERATALWLEIAPAGSRPSSTETLKSARRKSAVVRLTGAGEAGESIVAKRAARHSIEHEARVYLCVLSRLAVSAPRFHGLVADGEAVWMFIEDAGDNRFDPDLPDHRRLAASWMARAHSGGQLLPQVRGLPERGSDHYRELQRSADALLRETLGNPALSSREAAIVRDSSKRVAAIGASWADVKSRFERCPTTIALGGFGSKNARVRAAADGPALMPFDFESAGRGCPAIDLVHLDRAIYVREAQAWWPGLDAGEFERQRALGRLLGALKAIPGERRVLLGPAPAKAVAKLRWYRKELEATGP